MEINISVIIPCYNRKKTIERCIKSIMNQTVLPSEIIVVDDGSTDGSVEKIEQLDCSFLRLIKQNHKGAQAARNLGILNAKGNYIAFLDSDDEWKENMLQVCMDYLDKNPDYILYTDCYTYNDISKTRKKWILPGGSGNVYRELLKHPFPMFQGILVPKELLIQIGGLDENVVAYQEWETSIRMAKYQKMIHIRKPLFIYHFHDGDTISKSLRKDLDGYIYIVNKHKKEIIDICGYDELKKHYCIILKKAISCRKLYFWGNGVEYLFRYVILSIIKWGKFYG